jgi:cyclopropane fatty-acyl-phospholipid synthase-like methyltransferase
VSAATPPLFRASAQDDESVAQMVAVLDAQDSLPAARRLHDWAIETAAVRAGDQVVDLGSGTGTLSKRLAGLVAAATSPRTVRWAGSPALSPMPGCGLSP